MVKLLLALPGASAPGAELADFKLLQERAAEAFTAGLPKVSVIRLPNIVTQLAAAPSCQQQLKEAVSQAVNGLTELRPAQVMLMTRHAGLLGDFSRVKIVELWQRDLGNVAKASKVPSLSDQLTADQLAELGSMLVKLAPTGDFFEDLATILLRETGQLTASGIASLESAFPEDNGGPVFRSRRRLQRLVRGFRERGVVPTTEERDRSRSRDRRR